MLPEKTASESVALVSLSTASLARMIAAREVSATEVVDAHIAQIEGVNQRLRALVQPLFEQARADAATADRIAGDGNLPPLHGVPVTIKDCFDVRGTDVTLGIETRVGHPASADSPLVARLRAAGAIVLGKTNTHQGMLMHESDNPLFGCTNHPLCDQRSPGGSSGGESAIVAAFGSPLGLGSDLGGSIRQPAHCCGLCGLKPTTGRLTAEGSYRAMPGMQAVALQPGPLVRSVEDVDLAMRVLLDQVSVPRQHDEAIDPWPDFRAVELCDLRIGWFTDDGYFRPAPANRRAVSDAVASLRSAGATVVEFSPPDMREMMRVYMGLVTADGLATLGSVLSGTRREWQVRRQLALGRIPRWARAGIKPLLRLAGERYLAELVAWTGKRTVQGYWDLTVDAVTYRNRFRSAVDRVAGGSLDAVVLPAHGLPALRHRTGLDLLPAASYCFLPNLIGWPAGVVPTTRVGQAEESDRPGEIDRVIRTARRVEQGSTGLPIGVQVIARPWREDIVLAVMAELEKQALPASG